MPHLRIVERDYANLYNRFISLGRGIRDGLSAHGINIPVAEHYDELLENPVGGTPDTRHMRCVEWGGERYPSVEDALDAANVVLQLAPETNGEIALRGVPGGGEEDRPRPHRSRRGQPQRAHDVRRPRGPADPHADEPDAGRATSTTAGPTRPGCSTSSG